MHRLVVLLLFLILVAPSVDGAAAQPLDAPLPSDPRVVTARLDNGFTYVIRRHPTAEKRIGMWLHVSSGSLNETETTRGIAHFLEHLAFNGSTNFPTGALVPFFESLGLTFGRDQNAFTGFDQTTYQTMVPAGNTQALEKAVLFMSDVAGRLDLSPAEIERERQVILEEKRARSGASQRVQDQVLEKLAPESTLGRRLPIGTEATIRAVTEADFRDFYRRWYVPSNMTLIVAGDCDPAEVIALVTRHFGGFPSVPQPSPLPVGVRNTTGTRAIVATDPELTRADVSLVRVAPPRAPSTTVGDYRRDLVESFGTWIVSRRLDVESAEGRARFERASVSLSDWTGAARLATVRASGRPEQWREMFADLGQTLQRARRHGFTAREIEQARRAMLAQVRDAVARDATAPIRTVLGSLNGAVSDREPIVAPSQRLAILEQLLPGITGAEVSAVFAAAFDPTHVVAVANLPSAPANPVEDDIARVARAAVDVTPAAAPERAVATALIETPPRGGKIVSRDTDDVSAVTSIWLDNGVRAHHRTMEQRKGEIVVEITLAGGTIQETAATRGLTEAAAQALTEPATKRLTTTDVRELLTGARVTVNAEVGDDAVTVTVRTSPRDFETALQLTYLLLTDPVLEPAVLARWREGVFRRIARRTLEPMAALQFAAAEALSPRGEARMLPLGRDRVDAVTREAAETWLRRLVTTAPIEAAVVGDVDRDRALGLVAKYFGSLATRERIGPTTLSDLRRVSPPAGPLHVARTIDTRTPQAAVLSGFRGADLSNLPDSRRLTVAARVLSTRMYRTIREEKQLVYSIGASSRPGVAYPGFGVFTAQAPTDPGRPEILAREIEAMYAHFATEGPTEAEVTVARRQLAAQIDEQVQRPEFWAGRLSAIEYRGRAPREPLESRAHYERIQAGDVHETFRRYWRPESRFTVYVSPGAPPSGSPSPAVPAPAVAPNRAAPATLEMQSP